MDRFRYKYTLSYTSRIAFNVDPNEHSKTLGSFVNKAFRCSGPIVKINLQRGSSPEASAVVSVVMVKDATCKMAMQIEMSLTMWMPVCG